jgi:hypothetical protein
MATDVKMDNFYQQVILELEKEIGRLNTELALSKAREKLVLTHNELLKKEISEKEGEKSDGNS